MMVNVGFTAVLETKTLESAMQTQRQVLGDEPEVERVPGQVGRVPCLGASTPLLPSICTAASGYGHSLSPK